MKEEVLVSHRHDLVRVLHGRAGSWVETRTIEGGSWPTVGPDGSIVVTAVELTEEGRRARLDLVDPAGGRLTVPGSPTATFITPRLPIYSSWGPGGSRLAFVSSDGESIALSTWRADDPEASPLRLTSGMPLFHAWRPEGDALAVHAGEDLSVFSPDGDRLETVSGGAAGFRVPAWSDDGRLLAWAHLKDEVLEVLVRESGQDTAVARFEGGGAVAFRPHSHDLAVAVAGRPETGAFDSLHILRLGNERATGSVISDPFVAFAWSPDGTRLAMVVPAQSGDGRYRTVIRDPDGRVLASSEAVVPSIDTRLTLGFFDQYRLSQPWWSPESDGLLLCGRLAGDAVSDSFGDPAGGFAYWWSRTRRTGLTVVGAADVACFAPATGRT
ncbi:MAG: TolB family protein [Dehalococcoidia bacterium]